MYKTIYTPIAFEHTEKKSRFIAALSHAESEAEAVSAVAAAKAAHRKARHNVYAYVLREGNAARYCEDGEPSGSANLLPLMSARGVTDVVCVVTRYFGGVLLGAGPLARAYGKACGGAYDTAEVVTVTEYTRRTLRLSHADYGVYLRVCGGYDITRDDVFTDVVTSAVAIPCGTEAAFLADVTEQLCGRVVVEPT